MEITYTLTPPSLQQYAELFETNGWNDEYSASPEELMQASDMLYLYQT
jgi:hypothetical protein